MKLITLISLGLLFATEGQAGNQSSCHSDCFQRKLTCNSQRGHSFNSCDHDLFTCKAQCNSGQKQDVYASKPNLDIVFHPLIDADL